MADKGKDNKPKIITYNKEQFIQELSIFRIKTDYEESDKPADNLILFNDNVRSWKFFNDLFTGMPQVEIDFEDIGNQEIGKLRADGFTFIRIILDYKVKDTSKTITVAHDFILNDIEIINKKSESTVFRISGVGFYEAYKNAQIIYSSKTTKSATKIAEEILKAGNYPYEPDPELTHSNKKIHYIAPVNATLGDCIDEIFSYTSTPETGLYYFYHHIIDNKAKILSVNDVWKPGKRKVGEYNYVLIPTKENFKDMEFSLMDLDSNNYVKGCENYEAVKPVTMHNFNFMKRQWEKDKYTFKRLKDISYKAEEPTWRKVFKQNPKLLTNQIKYESHYEPVRYGRLQQKLHKLTMYSDVIQFKCTGNLKREIGELMAVSCGNEIMAARYAGLWMIVRCYHKFDGDRYYNEIIAVRSDEINPDETSSGSSQASVPKQ